jgi:hypothetical protein
MGRLDEIFLGLIHHFLNCRPGGGSSSVNARGWLMVDTELTGFSTFTLVYQVEDMVLKQLEEADLLKVSTIFDHRNCEIVWQDLEK